MGVLEQLKQTKKGNLTYARQTSGSNLKSLLESCSSPAHVRVPATFSKNVGHLKERETEEKKDEEKETYGLTNQKEIGGSKNSFLSSEIEDSWNAHEITSPNHGKSPITSPDYGKSRKAIKDYEKVAENEARKAVQVKQREFKENAAQIEKEAEENMKTLRQQADQNRLLQIRCMEQRQESHAAEIVKQHQTLKQTHEQRKQIHDAKIQAAEAAKQRLQEEELRRKQKENQQRLDMIVKSVADLKALNAKLQTMSTSCKYQDRLPDAAKNALHLMQQLVTNSETISINCQKSGDAGQEKVDKIRKHLEQAKNAYEFVKQEIDKANQAGAKAEAEAAQKAAAAAAAAAATAAVAAAGTVSAGQPSSTVGAQLAVSTPAPQSSASGSGLSSAAVAGAAGGESLCVDIEAFKQYTELQNKLKQVDQQIQNLSTTPQLKKYKFDIQKAVNTPINAISPVSGDHLRDKLQRLHSLLSGQQVDVAGKRISVKDHPDAAVFSKHLTARMIVKKGDEQVSSNHESAFAIAMVAVGLWSEHPDFGDILLAHFHSACPYIVPYYLPKQEGQTDEDYLKSRGYKCENGTFEKQDKFLKRMSGIMRLYSSILVSSPPRGKHPHGIEYAWIWLSRVMNIEPEPDITATMIYDLLQVTGRALCKEYKKQFLKLLHILIKEMLPKLNSVASSGGGGASVRLESLLETSVKNFGNIPVPEGYLASNFWTS